MFAFDVCMYVGIVRAGQIKCQFKKILRAE